MHAAVLNMNVENGLNSMTKLCESPKARNEEKMHNLPQSDPLLEKEACSEEALERALALRRQTAQIEASEEDQETRNAKVSNRVLSRESNGGFAISSRDVTEGGVPGLNVTIGDFKNLQETNGEENNRNHNYTGD